MCIIQYDTKSNQIITRASGDVKDKIGRDTENGYIGIVNPTGSLIGLHLKEGVFKAVSINNGVVSEAFNMR
jgi:hypothetical protein